MSQTAAVVRSLAEERDQRPDLAATLDLHLAVLAARDHWRPRVEPPCLTGAGERLARGEPALDLGALDPDWAAVRALAGAVCEAAGRHHPEAAAALRDVAVWLREAGVAEVRDVVRAHLTDAPRDGVLGFVLTQALQPYLRALADALGPVLATAPPGPRCPACGGAPDFAALEPDAGARRLLCARCDTEWLWQRLGCPRCGNESAESLGYFETGGAGAYRVYVCERCKRYLKTVDLRETWYRRPLPVERVVTVGMDVAALGEGYRPTVP
jgi:formate dehydrogenase maturation protein FdhE